MSDEPKPTKEEAEDYLCSCKFVAPDDKDARNDVLRRRSRTVDEWEASVNRCMEIVDDRLNEIERRIKEKAEGGTG